MIAAQEKIVETCKCPHCDQDCSNDIRPYVCSCGAVFGKNGWVTTITVKRSNSKNLHDYHTKKALDGRKAWSKLHRIDHGTPELFEDFKKYMPNGCECKKKVDAILKKIPPRYGSPEEWFEFTVEFHNEVNLTLDKPTVSLDRAYMLWRNRRPSTGKTRAVITVANGVEFSQILATTRSHMQAYADRVNADLIDLDNDTETWGPMEKFRVYEFAKQYDEVMFVDADCIITENCPDLFSMFKGDVVIHDDYGVLRSPSIINEERKRVSRLSGVDVPILETAFNTGVVITRGEAKHIWIRPTVEIGTSRFAEQVWIEGHINRNNFRVDALPHQANWQYWYGKHSQPITPFEDGVRGAWIVHASASTQKLSTIKRISDYLSIKNPQPLISGLTAVTSLSLLPHHIKVQERCLQSWMDMGLRVVAGNSERDIAQLREIYPYVDFVPCRQSDSYDRPTTRIYDLLHVVSGAFLLINSDIEMHGSQSILLDALKSRERLIGLRHNYDHGIFETNIERWGIDAFLLFPEDVESFPDLDFAIGQTMWDWWVPIHLESINAKIRWIGEPFFFHKSHPVHWKQESLQIGREMLHQQYKVPVEHPYWESWRKDRPFSDGVAI
jgi:hypothetical protein